MVTEGASPKYIWKCRFSETINEKPTHPITNNYTTGKSLFQLANAQNMKLVP